LDSIQIVLIDRRRLERECFVRGVEAINPSIRVHAFANVAAWIERAGRPETPAAILYSSLGRRIAEPGVADEIVALEKAARPVPVIVLSPFEELSEMIAALECGARGYIPASLGIEAMLTAVRLSEEGAVFMTTASVLALRDAIEARKEPSAVAPRTEPSASVAEEQFTARQSAVADRLRRGKPNKLIAYELNMCESTVKVHIRNIMKKLRVTNRTEAGFKLNVLVSEAERNSLLAGAGPAPADVERERNVA
jgi:DNA-binding NarL/FixJ family response regulator